MESRSYTAPMPCLGGTMMIRMMMMMMMMCKIVLFGGATAVIRILKAIKLGVFTKRISGLD